MTDKTLKDRAIKYNGRDYVQVSDRVNYFNETYKNGSITTEVLYNEGQSILIKATVETGEGQAFTGLASLS